MQITDEGLLFLIYNKFLPNDKKKINPSVLKGDKGIMRQFTE